MQHFDKELTNAFAKNDYVLITGDINIDYLKPLPSNWETILLTYGLDQLVHDPTRVTSKSVTLIEHIYTSRKYTIHPPPFLFVLSFLLYVKLSKSNSREFILHFAMCRGIRISTRN
jgi:hypothetical protein